jgi:hypothetical protein
MNVMTISKTLKSLAVSAAIIAAVVMSLVSPGAAAPRAEVGNGVWTLDIDYTTPQPIVLKLPGQRTPQLFWYFTYTVTNHTGQDRMFTPEIVLYTATGQIIQAGAKINPYVYRAIKKVYNDPMLQDGLSVMGKLLQGDDNAKSGIVVFRNFDPMAAKFDIFFGGLSNDSEVVKLPSPIEVITTTTGGKTKKVQKDSVILAKTLWLKYRIGTEASDRAQARPKLISKDWIMR